MTVKTAQPGNVVTETRTTVVTPQSEARRLSDGTPIVSAPEFWDWIENTPVETLSKYDVQVNLYRRALGGGRGDSLCEQIYYPPDNIKFSRRWIKQFYGGGGYKVMCRMEKQLRFSFEFDIEGMPKRAEEIESAKAANGSGGAAAPSYSGMGSETTMVLRELVGMLRDELRAARGGGASETAVQNAVQLSGQVFSSAVGAATETLRNVNGAAPAAPSPQNALIDRLLTAMVDRMLNPPAPADPLATFERVSTVLKNLSAGEGGGHESLAQTIARIAPVVLDKVQSGLANVVTLRQQELELMRMRGGAPPQPGAAAPPITVQPPLPAAPANGTPPAPPAAQPQDQGMQMLDFIELGIARIALNQANTVDQAAYEILVLLDAYVPELVTATCNDPNGESELLKMFRERPILQQVPQNPRLTELVQKFLEKARASRTPVDPPEGANVNGIPPATAEQPAQPSA